MNLVDRSHDFIRALEEEKKKILMFQRELPLCLQLVSQAIDNLRQITSSGDDNTTADTTPVLAEFLPSKPNTSISSNEQIPAIPPDQKPDWLRSVQLWNQESDLAPKTELPKKPIAVNAKKIGGAFHPFEREKAVAVNSPSPAPAVVIAENSSTESSSGGSADVFFVERKEKQEQSKCQAGLSGRKARRCWSPDLHRHFLQALQHLGGSNVATPKQIRDLMKVDGLTNDEVKSHLQKYRLHTRRPNPSAQSNNNGSTAAPQFVVVGGIWVPSNYAVAAPQPNSPPTVRTEIYAPIALHPVTDGTSRKKQHQLNKNQPQRSPTGPLAYDGQCSDDNKDDNDATNSVSPSLSSSSQTMMDWHQL